MLGKLLMAFLIASLTTSCANAVYSEKTISAFCAELKERQVKAHTSNPDWQKRQIIELDEFIKESC